MPSAGHYSSKIEKTLFDSETYILYFRIVINTPNWGGPKKAHITKQLSLRALASVCCKMQKRSFVLSFLHAVPGIHWGLAVDSRSEHSGMTNTQATSSFCNRHYLSNPIVPAQNREIAPPQALFAMTCRIFPQKSAEGDPAG